MAKAKYDSITLAEFWNGTLDLLNCTAAGTSLPPCDYMTVSVPFGYVTLVFDSIIYNDPVEHAYDDPPFGSEPGAWNGAYGVYDLTVSAGTGMTPTTDTQRYYVWQGDVFGPYTPSSFDGGSIVNTAGSLSIDWSFTLSGIVLYGQAEDASPSGRGFLWFGDRTFDSAWYADSATITVDAGPLSVNDSNTGIADGLVSLGTNIQMTMILVAQGYPAADTTYFRIGTPKWADEAIDLSALLLYNPGTGTAPDTTNAPNWKRTPSGSAYGVLKNDSGIALQWHGAGYLTATPAWTGVMKAPHIVNFQPMDGKFSDEVSYSIEYYGPPILWAADAVPEGELSAGLSETVDGTTYYAYYDTWTSTKAVTQQDKSWEFEYEWKRLSTTNLWVKELPDWRTTNDEDVGESDDSQDDVDVPLLIHPRNSADLLGEPDWGTFITLAHEGEIPVCKPSGVSRPANWTGSGGLTPQAASGSLNDSWDVAAGSSAPKATFVLPCRYWTRMARLADHLATETYHLTYFPYLNKPNVDSTPSDGYLDPVEERIDEAEWHWRNYSYLELRFTTAPRNATITVDITYSYPSWIEDPCYTCFEHRYGTEGSFDYGRATRTARWTADITAGSSKVSDAMCLAIPLVGVIDPELHTIDSISLTFNASAGDETWVLDDIYLVLDKSAQPPRPTWHEKLRMYDPYDWLADYTMFAGIIDGVPVFRIRYGFDDLERSERSLKGRQKRRHCPDTGLPGILDYAKTIPVLEAEVDFQRGWNATDADAVEGAVNKDGTGNYVVTSFRWFDLKEGHEYSFDGSQVVTGQPRVKTWQIVAGVEHDIYHVKYPQGRVHALAYESDRSGRNRSGTGFYLWQKLGAGSWAQVEGPVSADGFGYLRFAPQKEKDYETDTYWIYGMSEASDETPTVYGSLANRRYLWSYIPSPSEKGVCLIEQLPGFVYIPYTDEGIRHVYNAPADYWFRLHSSQAHYALPKADTTDDDSSPSGYVAGDGVVRLFVLRSGDLYRLDSLNWGLTWEAEVATPISGDQAYTWSSRDGVNQFCVYVSGGTLTFAASHDHFSTVDESAAVSTGVDASQVCGYHGPDGAVYAYGFVDGTLTCWKSITRGRTWTEIGTV